MKVAIVSFVIVTVLGSMFYISGYVSGQRGLAFQCMEGEQIKLGEETYVCVKQSKEDKDSKDGADKAPEKEKT